MKDEKPMEELVKIVIDFRVFMNNLADELAKALADIKAPEKEDTWEMKCPYKIGNTVWFINVCGDVYSSFWLDSSVDMESFKEGNTFPTKKAAELEAKRRNLLTRFRAFRDECNNGWKPDWKIHSDSKYYISSVGNAKLTTFYTGITNNFQLFGYFKNEQDAERAIELFGDEIKELFVEKRLENENN